MTTDEERRKVARRLRERAGKRVLNFGELLWCIDCDDGDDAAAWNRLADLVWPSAPKVRCVAEVKVDGEQLEKLVHDAAVELTGIDRDALLALADELEEDACWEVQTQGDTSGAWRAKDTCDRIREALGAGR